MTGGVMIDLLTPPTSSLRTPLAPASSARKQYSPASLWLTSMTAEACAWACAEEMHFSAAMAADSLAFDLPAAACDATIPSRAAVPAVPAPGDAPRGGAAGCASGRQANRQMPAVHNDANNAASMAISTLFARPRSPARCDGRILVPVMGPLSASARRRLYERTREGETRGRASDRSVPVPPVHRREARGRMSAVILCW